MATSTADRWFVSDHVYDSTNADYAVVGCKASDIRIEIFARDSAPQHFTHVCCPPQSFLDVLYAFIDGQYGYSFAYARNALVYADVDQSDPTHEKELRAKVAAVQNLDEETEKSQGVRAKMVQYLLDHWNKNKPNDQNDYMAGGSATEDCANAYLDRTVGTAPPVILGSIVNMNEEERREALMLISWQAKLPAEVQRPVLVLIGIVDTAQSTVVGTSEGYKIAFDPLTKELIIRPFLSNEQTHLLGDNWFADIPADGISFRGTARDFVTKSMEFVNEVKAEGYTLSEADGFKGLVWAPAMNWILDQSPKLVKEEGDTTIEGLTRKDFDKGVFAVEKKLRDLKFPTKEKVGQEKYEEKDALNYEVHRLKDEIMVSEVFLRDAAVDAKGEGKEKKALEAARMWDRIMEAIKDFEAVAEEEECIEGVKSLNL